MMDALCIAKVNINAFGQKTTRFDSCGFCGGTSVKPNPTRKRVNYISMNPIRDTISSLNYINIKIGAPVIVDCTPTSLEIKYSPYWDDIEQPDYSLPITGKYRINGGDWIYYLHDSDTANYNAPRQFLENIILPNGVKAIDMSGTGAEIDDDGTWIGVPFSSYQGRDYLHAASSGGVLTETQVEAVGNTPTTIEFEVENNNANDMVFLLFGGNATAHACAMGFWEGR